ncbi:MAG TPA: heme-copper oxidase subunit III [Bacteroidia bacterium]
METTLSPVPQRKVISNGMIAMILFLAAEIMFFAGLISAYVVNKAFASAMPAISQPRLPVEVTAANTILLLASAVTIFLFSRNYKQEKRSIALLAATMLIGIIFIAVQGTEWVQLLSFGFSTHSSLYGAFFYTIIGAHALHVIIGLSLLVYLFVILKKSRPIEDAKSKIAVCSLYWYFVVGIWPVLYFIVYLF